MTNQIQNIPAVSSEASAVPSAPSMPDGSAPEPYDPAEYRWVPVRRRPRHDGWTEEKQRRFVEVLADTGLVSHAAKAVGMSRESANRLRRSPHGAAFARACDAARQYAGAALEDVAFERAIEGVEQNIYNEYGEVVCTKRVVNDRLLTFLLSHLMPERYGKEGRSAETQTDAPPPEMLEASLRAMEPQLPAPPEELLGEGGVEEALAIADAADGVLPQFLSEQHPAKSDAQLEAEEIAAQEQRVKAAWDKSQGKECEVSSEEFRDMCHYLDPTCRADKGRKRYR